MYFSKDNFWGGHIMSRSGDPRLRKMHFPQIEYFRIWISPFYNSFDHLLCCPSAKLRKFVCFSFKLLQSRDQNYRQFMHSVLVSADTHVAAVVVLGATTASDICTCTSSRYRSVCARWCWFGRSSCRRCNFQSPAFSREQWRAGWRRRSSADSSWRWNKRYNMNDCEQTQRCWREQQQ